MFKKIKNDSFSQIYTSFIYISHIKTQAFIKSKY